MCESRRSRSRAVLRPLAGAAAALLLACGGEADRADRQKVEVDPAEVERIHRDAIVVDTHSDTTPRFQDPDWDFTRRHPKTDSHMDLPRIREGGLDVQFWSIYLGRQEGDGRAIREALERIDAVHQLVERHPDELALATTVREIREAVAAGKLACLMGVEGGLEEGDRVALQDPTRQPVIEGTQSNEPAGLQAPGGR